MTAQQTYDPHGGELVPVPVHIISTGPGVLAPSPAPTRSPRRTAVNLRTVFLSAVNPVVPLLGKSPRRCETWLTQYGDADFVLCDSESDAVSVSGEASYANGTAGALVPKGLTAPLCLKTTDAVWVAGNSTDLGGTKVIRVGVIEVTYAED